MPVGPHAVSIGRCEVSLAPRDKGAIEECHQLILACQRLHSLLEDGRNAPEAQARGAPNRLAQRFLAPLLTALLASLFTSFLAPLQDQLVCPGKFRRFQRRVPLLL